MRSKIFAKSFFIILFFILFTQSRNTYGQYQTSTLIIENNTNATISIYIERDGVRYEKDWEDIPPMKTMSLKNLLPMGRNVVIAAARKAPMKKFQDEFGNIIQEYYSAKDVFWVSEEGTKVHNWVLTSDLFGATDLEDKMEITPGDTESIPDLTGTWKSQKGVYEIVQTENKVEWFGKGDYEGKHWEHKATGEITGKTIKANFKDTENSSWAGNSRDVEGTISEDGNSIHWPTLNKYETHWNRQ
jgi:hypothetical protein